MNITINGKKITLPDNNGDVVIQNCNNVGGNVIINGQVIDDKIVESKVINISIEGDVKGNVSTDNGNITVSGSCKDVTTVNGDISTSKVMGDVKTTNGDVEVSGEVIGNVSTVNGDISHR